MRNRLQTVCVYPEMMGVMPAQNSHATVTQTDTDRQISCNICRPVSYEELTLKTVL